MEFDDQPFQPNAPASTEAVTSLRTGLAKSLPDSYFVFLARANGGEGFIGDRYVQLWRVEELLEMNRAYKTAEFFPNLFFIGSDGGGEAYAFDLSAHGRDGIRGSIYWLADRRKGNSQFVRFISGDLKLGSMSEMACSQQLSGFAPAHLQFYKIACLLASLTRRFRVYLRVAQQCHEFAAYVACQIGV